MGSAVRRRTTKIPRKRNHFLGTGSPALCPLLKGDYFGRRLVPLEPFKSYALTRDPLDHVCQATPEDCRLFDPAGDAGWEPCQSDLSWI